MELLDKDQCATIATDGRAIELSQSIYRGDTYDFVAELSSPNE